jgi:PIN domain nuclease of toxin-antitoxin system
VRYLLDTHVWLWLASEPERIRPGLLADLDDPETDLLLSAAVSWEIAIKWALGRIALPDPPASYVPDRMRRLNVTGLPVEHAHALQLATLPRHHGDPSTGCSSRRPRSSTCLSSRLIGCSTTTMWKW